MRLPNIALAAIFISLFGTGCYTKYYSVSAEDFPSPIRSIHHARVAGVSVNAASAAPKASSISPQSVADLFVKRLVDEEIFSDVVYPYTDLAHVEADVLIDLTVKIEEHPHWGENIPKAIFTGLSFFLLAPVLPIRFTEVVDLTAAVESPQRTPLANYRYRSEYDLKYTTLVPDTDTLEEWLERVQEHAVEDILNQMKSDSYSPRADLAAPWSYCTSPVARLLANGCSDRASVPRHPAALRSGAKVRRLQRRGQPVARSPATSR